VAEEEATLRATLLAKAAGAPVFVVHVSCLEAMVAVREARESGVDVFGETCPHYLTLGVETLSLPDLEGAKFVCSPPLRDSFHHDPSGEPWKTGGFKSLDRIIVAISSE